MRLDEERHDRIVLLKTWTHWFLSANYGLKPELDFKAVLQ